MTTKTVYSFHPFTREYLGPLTLDESDRSPLEPDVWHIPGSCLEAEPPVPPAGKFVAEEGGAWVLRDIPQPPAPPAPPPEPEPVPPTEEQMRQAIVDVIQDYLDDMARMLGYDDNLGAGSLDGTTIQRLANAGDLAGACTQMPRWVYGTVAGQRTKLPGLVDRRDTTRELCAEWGRTGHFSAGVLEVPRP